MSEQQQTGDATETEAATETEQITLPDDHPLVRTLAEQKKAIKELKARAARLDEIEESQKSEADKAAERLSKAEQRAAEAEARVLRREVAIEHKLDKDDAALLDALTDEDAMRRFAERLATAGKDKQKTHVVRGEGKTQNSSATSADPRRAWLRENVRDGG